MITDYEAEAPKAGKKLWIAGGIVTAAWLTLVVIYIARRWAAFGSLEPNAIGDFAAGVFAPLAFLWLVLGFFQQGEELRNSGKALWLQGKELQASVEQQRQLVEVTREQLQFESQMLEEQREELARKARPVLALRSGGNSGGSTSDTRLFQFNVLNTGNPCTDVAVNVDGSLRMTKPLLGTGDLLHFTMELPSADIEPMGVTVTYLDARTLRGEARFTISKTGGRFTITEAGEDA